MLTSCLYCQNSGEKLKMNSQRASFISITSSHLQMQIAQFAKLKRYCMKFSVSICTYRLIHHNYHIFVCQTVISWWIHCLWGVSLSLCWESRLEGWIIIYNTFLPGLPLRLMSSKVTVTEAHSSPLMVPFGKLTTQEGERQNITCAFDIKAA